MRTTVTIDDDVLTAAREVARSRGVSLGRVLSDLARRGLQGSLVRVERGFPVLDVTETSPVISSEDVREALAEE